MRSQVKIVDEFVNSEPENCPVVYSIIQRNDNKQRKWGGVNDVLRINEAGYVELVEQFYEGETINAQLAAFTPYREYVLKPIRVTQKIVKPPICVSQTVSTTNDDEYVIFASPKKLAEDDPIGTQKLLISTDTVSSLFTNSDAYNCPVTFYLIEEQGRDLSYLLNSKKNFVRINENGYFAVDEARYTGLTYAFKVMAITKFDQPIFKTVKIAVKLEKIPSNTVVYTIISVLSTLAVGGLVAYIYSIYAANVTAARAANQGRVVSQDDTIDDLNRVGAVRGGIR